MQLTKILPVDTQLHYCESVDVYRGLPLSGGLHETQASDDRDFVINPGFTLVNTEPPVKLVFASTLSNTPTELLLNLETSVNTPGLKRIVELFDFSADQFVPISSEAGSFDTDFISTIDMSQGSSEIGNFINVKANQVMARVSWKVAGFTIVFPWAVTIDDIHWQSR